MKTALIAIVLIAVGVTAAFWVAPPFGSFAILAKPVAK